MKEVSGEIISGYCVEKSVYFFKKSIFSFFPLDPSHMIIQVVIVVAAVFSIEIDVVNHAKKCGVCKRGKKEENNIFLANSLKGN